MDTSTHHPNCRCLQCEAEAQPEPETAAFKARIQQCRNSVVLACAEFENVAKYIAQVESQREGLLEAAKGLLSELTNGQNVPSLWILDIIRGAVKKAE